MPLRPAFPQIIGRTRTRVPIVDRAVSNSGDYGFCFDQEKRFNHLFNPANSGWADFYASELGVCGLAFSDS
jgi:thiamine biosynthesis lipoprotein